MKALEVLLSLLGVAAPFAIAVTLIVLGLLSQRLGAVTGTPPFYRWFYVSSLLVSLAAFFAALNVLSAYTDGAGILYEEGFYLLTYGAPMVIGMTISAVVAWRYWGWLLGEPGE